MDNIKKAILAGGAAVVGGLGETQADLLHFEGNAELETVTASLVSGLVALIFAQISDWLKRRKNRRKKDRGEMD